MLLAFNFLLVSTVLANKRWKVTNNPACKELNKDESMQV